MRAAASVIFSCHEGFTSAFALVVKEYAVYSKHAIAFAVVLCNPKAILFGYAIGAAGINGVVSLCGTSCTFPKSSEVEAW